MTPLSSLLTCLSFSCIFLCSFRDFYIWTFVHDMSEVASVEFHYRKDNDGENPIHNIANEVYACDHKFVGDWVSVKMNERIFPKVSM